MLLLFPFQMLPDLNLLRVTSRSFVCCYSFALPFVVSMHLNVTKCYDPYRIFCTVCLCYKTAYLSAWSNNRSNICPSWQPPIFHSSSTNSLSSVQVGSVFECPTCFSFREFLLSLWQIVMIIQSAQLSTGRFRFFRLAKIWSVISNGFSICVESFESFFRCGCVINFCRY